MASILHVKGQLETLEQELDGSCTMINWLIGDRETGEDLAEVAGLMASVASTLMLSVTNFFSHWDFAEDCRREKLKEQAPEAVAAGGAR
jgi:hypothetical protein